MIEFIRSRHEKDVFRKISDEAAHSHRG